MKKILTVLAVLFYTATTWAQTPQKMSYQAVIRDNTKNIISNHTVGMKISILQGSATGATVYSETQKPATNVYGLVSIQIGGGDGFNEINWANGPYFIKTEIDPLGGIAYSITGTSQLLSIPYALMAKTAIRSLNDLDTSATNELQIIKLSNDTLYLDRGGFIYLGAYNDNNAVKLIKNKISSDSLYFESKINNEKTERLVKDDNLDQKIMSDSNYLKGLIIANEIHLANEIDSRIALDQSLKTKQVYDSTYLKGLIDTETTNRTNSDNSIQTIICNLKAKQISDSSMFSTALAGTNANLASETSSRIAFDQSLKTKVVADSSYLKGQINTTNIVLSITNNNLATANANLATTNTNLSTETTSRITSDNTLQTNINSFKTKVVADSLYLKGQINSTNSNLITETISRIAADNGIKAKVVSDSAFLKSQINSTNTNLSNEINTRITNDQGLKTKIIADSTYLKGLINNKQAILHPGSGITINSANVIKAIDTSITNELQTISRRNDTIFLSNGGFVKLPSNITNATYTHFVGEIFQGGIIVYVWKVGSVEHGLIASLTDLSAGMIWTTTGYQSITVPSASLSPIDGLANSNAIIAQAGGGINYAAGLCRAYSAPGDGNVSDWYLPSAWELNQCYNSAFVVNNVLGAANGFQNAYYWSSTEYSNNAAWLQYFGVGNTTNGLKSNATYRVRAVRKFATNNVNDVSGNVYDTINIGSQVWLKQNLKTTKYRNGDAIPNVTGNTIWSGLTTGAYCDYANTPSNSTSYGRLYNWYTVNDSRKICPTGYHVPTDAEWTTLETYLGGSSAAGGKLKEIGLSHWLSPNTGATNSTGFTALPGGYRDFDGTYSVIGSDGLWWSSTENSSTSVWYRSIDFNYSTLFKYDYYKIVGFSVRCLKD